MDTWCQLAPRPALNIHTSALIMVITKKIKEKLHIREL